MLLSHTVVGAKVITSVPEPLTLKLVAGFRVISPPSITTGSLKVMVILLETVTFTALVDGVLEITVGAIVSLIKFILTLPVFPAASVSCK